MFIFLDDVRMPGDVSWIKLPTPQDGKWIIVRNYDEFVALLEHSKKQPTFISFDHDLEFNHYKGDFSSKDEKTGLHCARALIEICLDRGWRFPKYTCHSMNPIGKKNIEETLEGARKRWF